VRTHTNSDDLAGRRRYRDSVARTVDRVGAWAALIKVHAAVVPLLEAEVEAKGLSLSWYDVLLVLNAAPDRRLRMSELGGQAVLSRTRVSRVVTELEKAGLVIRYLDQDDRRSSFAEITPEGRSRLRRVVPTYVRGIHRHFAAHLTDDEIETVTRALGRVLEAEAG
jgi:DNA-binding MarR family transcriptional regulator